jgi:hypothetical protein
MKEETTCVDPTCQWYKGDSATTGTGGVDPNTAPVSPNPIDPSIPNPGDFGNLTPVDSTPHHCVNKLSKTTAGYVAT